MGTCNVDIMGGLLMDVDLALGFLRLHLKFLKLLQFSLQEHVLKGFLQWSKGFFFFFWPDEDGQERASASGTKPPMLPDVFEIPEFATVNIQRDLFYGYDTVMENVSDPSHIDFAHLKVTGRRDRAKPSPFKVESCGPWSFGGSNEGTPKIGAKFVAPCYYMNKIEIDRKLPIVGEQKWKIRICSFNAPMAPWKRRLIICSAQNFFQFTVPVTACWQVSTISLCF
ncbi:hypothetical protein DITRI_Ditri14bG0052400 [Diplodiscus trichospermus]